MTRRRLTTLPIALLLAGCASAPQGPPPFDPAGTYAYSASVEGMAISGTMTIDGADGAYGGQLLSDMAPPIPINSVVVDGQAVTIEASGPQGPLTIQVTASGSSVEGTWTMAGMNGSFSGTKTN